MNRHSAAGGGRALQAETHGEGGRCVCVGSRGVAWTEVTSRGARNVGVGV